MSDMRHACRDERGGIATFFAVTATALLLLAAFVIDVANWFEHRRHLQVQVDAGALAAGQEFTGCYQDPDTTNKKIAGTSHQFAGDSDFSTYWTTLFTSPPATPVLPVPPGPYNLQVDKPERVTLRLNSPAYAPGGADFTEDLRPAIPGVQSTPCDALILDVKATDQGIPSFFGSVIPDSVNPLDVKAKARVEIRQVESLSGFLPWAIPEVDPKHIAVVFVNETTNTVVRAFELTNPPGGVTVLNGTPVDVWQGSMIDVDIQKQTGMVVVQSRLGSDPDNDPPFTVSGTLAEICAQPKTFCHLGNTPTASSGLLHIRANTPATGGTLAAPVLGPVTLLPGNCAENSAPFFLVAADCNIGVRAVVDFGPTCGANPSANPCQANVRAVGNACGGATNLSYSAGAWSATCGNPRIPAQGGQRTLRIEWKVGGGSNWIAFGGLNDPAGRIYAKDVNGGPFEYVSVSPNPAAAPGPQAVSVTVGVPPSLQVANKLEPPILLRFKERNGPNTQQVDCDAAPRGPDEEIGTGCLTTYDDDEDGICPPEYDEGNELPPSEYKADPIPTCAAIRPGSVQSLVDGLRYRFENPAQPYGSCPPNNWPDVASEPLPGPSDPRWQILIVTEGAAFRAPPGQDPVVPVLKWAGFYVTGWDKSSATNGCPDDPTTPKDDGNDPHPLGYPSNQDNGDIWGHFVNYVPFLPGATASESFCNFNEIGLCIAVLTQ